MDVRGEWQWVWAWANVVHQAERWESAEVICWTLFNIMVRVQVGLYHRPSTIDTYYYSIYSQVLEPPWWTTLIVELPQQIIIIINNTSYRYNISAIRIQPSFPLSKILEDQKFATNGLHSAQVRSFNFVEIPSSGRCQQHHSKKDGKSTADLACWPEVLWMKGWHRGAFFSICCSGFFFHGISF